MPVNRDPTTGARVDRRREYVSGGTSRELSPLASDAARVLSRFQDDLNREFTDKAYDDMLRDPAVAASVDTLKALILTEPPRVISRVQDRDDPGYARAQEVADYVALAFRQMDRPLQAALWEALEAIAYGSALAELLFEESVLDDRPVLRLKDIRTRSRSKYALVVDRGYNVLGAVPTEFGTGGSGTTVDPKTDPQFVPRSKFMLLTLSAKNSDPRGTSLIRPAWNAYYLKTQVWPAYLKFLVQFASPSIVGYTPEGAEDVEALSPDGAPVVGPDGVVATVSAEEDMLTTLLGFQNGTVAVLKGGSKLDLIKSEGHGEAFAAAVELFDRQIAMAILKTHRTLLEAKHSSKADSESAADLTDVFVASLREVVAATLTRDVVRVLVEVNLGADVAAQYAPEVTLKSVPRQDFGKAADAVAKLWAAKYLHTSQVAEADALIGLPERDMDAFLAELSDEEEARRIDQAERMKLMAPGAGTTMPAEEPVVADGDDDE